MAADNQIRDVSLVNARLLNGVSFHLTFGVDWDSLLVQLSIRDPAGKHKRMEFPHAITPAMFRENWLPIGSSGPFYDLIGMYGFTSVALSRRDRETLAGLLKDRVHLEIGFYHDDIDKSIYEERRWFVGEDQDADHCGCRFAIQIDGFKSAWWMGWYRVKKILVCTREEDREYDRSWKYRDDDGWGLGGYR